MVLAAAEFVSAQQTAPPPSSAAPAGEEEQRSASETRERLEQLACGPSDVHLTHHTLKGPQSLPEQPADKGLIYVIRTKNPFGAAVQAKLAMDGKWVGVNRPANYFYVEADSGPRYFCLDAFGGSRGLLSLVIEKGKTYYLLQNLTMGGADLDLLDEEKGKQYVAKYNRSTFDVKTKK
jgi:hypothetical protein